MKRSRAPSSLAPNTRQQHSATASASRKPSSSSHHQEESQHHSLEVDVGMEDLLLISDNTPVGNACSDKPEPGGRRRSGPRASGGGGGSRSRGRGAGSNGSNGPDAADAAEEVSNGSTAKARRGRASGGSREAKVKEEATAPTGAARATAEGAREEEEAGGKEGGDGAVNPPPKKKKKYIRNPETHKEYRARMEAELAQARVSLTTVVFGKGKYICL